MCEPRNRDCTRTGYNCAFMVKPLTGPKKEPLDDHKGADDKGTAMVDEVPDWRNAEDDDMGEWRFPSWEETA